MGGQLVQRCGGMKCSVMWDLEHTDRLCLFRRTFLGEPSWAGEVSLPARGLCPSTGESANRTSTTRSLISAIEQAPEGFLLEVVNQSLHYLNCLQSTSIVNYLFTAPHKVGGAEFIFPSYKGGNPG